MAQFTFPRKFSLIFSKNTKALLSGFLLKKELQIRKKNKPKRKKFVK